MKRLRAESLQVHRNTKRIAQIWRFDLRAVEALPKEGGRRPPVNEKDKLLPAGTVLDLVRFKKIRAV
jgi:hypothetical protein